MTEPRRNPVKAVQVLDSMLEFFDDGRRWNQGAMFDATGNRCLIGALRHIRATLRMRGDGTIHYLRSAAPPIWDDPLLGLFLGANGPSIISQAWKRCGHPDADLMYYNDRCDDYDEIRDLISQARDLAQAELDGQRDKQKEPGRGPAAAPAVTRPGPASPKLAMHDRQHLA